jgi:hypothetical protein
MEQNETRNVETNLPIGTISKKKNLVKLADVIKALFALCQVKNKQNPHNQHEKFDASKNRVQKNVMHTVKRYEKVNKYNVGR